MQAHFDLPSLVHLIQASIYATLNAEYFHFSIQRIGNHE